MYLITMSMPLPIVLSWLFRFFPLNIKLKLNVYLLQIFLKIGAEEWNVYHRYAKFHELHTQLKKSHPDIASYKFPPKKTLGKRVCKMCSESSCDKCNKCNFRWSGF